MLGNNNNNNNTSCPFRSYVGTLRKEKENVVNVTRPWALENVNKNVNFNNVDLGNKNSYWGFGTKDRVWLARWVMVKRAV